MDNIMDNTNEILKAILFVQSIQIGLLLVLQFRGRIL